MNRKLHILFLIGLLSGTYSSAQDSIISDSLIFSGQVSVWSHFNPDNQLPVYIGGRYIPQLNYEIRFPGNRLLDFEGSANLYGETGFQFIDSAKADGNIKPYRLWGRYSTKQLEFRIGMQKINFGSASMLRAIRWFDQVDPRDPLQLTDGVWGILGRYYFLNNTNIWLWVLYGNNNAKGYEFIETNSKTPEFGGRIQFPISKGEAALSYHHRTADSRENTGYFQPYSRIPENRIAFDTKLDLTVGLWIEGSWTNYAKDMGIFTNQEIVSVGTDYTFGCGNGLTANLEHMLIATDKNAFEFKFNQNFSALSLMYPVGLFDNLNAIVYYDWKQNNWYRFIRWHRQFDNTALYVMGYWNPEINILPGINTEENLFGGTGIQLMFVYNH